MDKKEVMKYVAAFLSSLNGTSGAPESTFYMALGMDMDKWQYVRFVLTAEPAMVRISGNYVTLTPYGRELAERIDSVMAKASN